MMAVSMTEPWLDLTVVCDAEAVETVTELFASYDFNQGVVVEPAVPQPERDATFAVAPRNPVTVRTVLRAGDVAPEQLEAIRDSLWNLRQALWLQSRSRPIGPLEIVERREEEWVNAWKGYYSVYHVGHRIHVKAPWHDYEPATGEVVVELDPGRAFGIGYHPSTQLGAMALEEELAAGDRVLDVGTGSGILAIAAALLGARAVDAVDIEPVAVRLARENAARNGVGGIVRVAAGSIGPGEPYQGEYDLVIANIISPVLIELAPALARAVAPGGTLILAGILDEKEPSVREAFSAGSLSLLRRMQIEEWVALVWSKPD